MSTTVKGRRRSERNMKKMKPPATKKRKLASMNEIDSSASKKKQQAKKVAFNKRSSSSKKPKKNVQERSNTKEKNANKPNKHKRSYHELSDSDTSSDSDSSDTQPISGSVYDANKYFESESMSHFDLSDESDNSTTSEYENMDVSSESSELSYSATPNRKKRDKKSRAKSSHAKDLPSSSDESDESSSSTSSQSDDMGMFADSPEPSDFEEDFETETVSHSKKKRAKAHKKKRDKTRRDKKKRAKHSRVVKLSELEHSSQMQSWTCPAVKVVCTPKPRQTTRSKITDVAIGDCSGVRHITFFGDDGREMLKMFQVGTICCVSGPPEAIEMHSYPQYCLSDNTVALKGKQIHFEQVLRNDKATKRLSEKGVLFNFNNLGEVIEDKDGTRHNVHGRIMEEPEEFDGPKGGGTSMLIAEATGM